MNTAATNTANAGIEMYWNTLKGLDISLKKKLIDKLSVSIATDRKAKADKGWASEFAGKWVDSHTTEEIIDDIRSSRTTNSDIELL